jgi:2',3'-cyclic-nucleotide 2'-phosphodiesterase (5'-nucleotidase family)
VARRATIIHQEREQGGLVLVLDAGDSLVGDRDPARRTQGETSVAAMNMLGYDALVLGPQDLALGPDLLRQRLAEAEFAVLSANAVVSDTGELVAAPYVVRELGNHRLAIVGISGGSDTQEIALRDPLETARAIVAKVAPQANLIILLSHAGARTDQQIAEAVPAIDLVISGGQFQLDTPWQDEETGILILHADASSPGHAGRRLGIARLTFDAAGRLTEHEWQRLVLGPEIADDPEMENWTLIQMTR